jgi:hypothetical protein
MLTFRPVDSYLVIGCITSGHQSDDLITAFPHLRVEGAKIVSAGSRLLGWHRLAPDIDLERLTERVIVYGRYTGVWLTDLRERGEDPVEVLAYARDMLRGLPPGVEVVGHNVLGSDLAFLRGHFRRWLGDEGDWLGRLPVHDVGLVEKARAAGITRWSCETKRRFLERVAGERLRDVRWNLKLCRNKYPLVKKKYLQYPRSFDQTDQGSLLSTAICVHLLYEAQMGTLREDTWTDGRNRCPSASPAADKTEVQGDR